MAVAEDFKTSLKVQNVRVYMKIQTSFKELFQNSIES